MTDNNLELYLKALDSANSGIIITDNNLPDNPIIYCNKAFEKITGYAHEEIIGHNCRFLQMKDRSQPERTILKKHIQEGEECRVEIRNYKKNGDLFWNELYISPVKDKNGAITHFIGVQNDITDRKKVEQDLREEKASVERKVKERTQELQENEAFLSSIIQTVRESLLVLDPDFRVVSVNSYFLKTFKVTEEETIGKILYELGNHQWDIEPLREMLIKILPTNNPVIDFEVDHDFPYIGRKLMLLNAYRIEFEGQYKDRILLAIEDITDKREIDRRKDDFLSIASHELKTPLTTIKTLVQLLERMLDKGIDDKFRSTLHKVSVNIERLNNLITELLDTSKIHSGNIEINRKPFDINALVHETVENSLYNVSSSHEIEIKGTTEAIVEGDEIKISQVLNNIVSNAVKYSPGQRKIEILLGNVGNFVKVSVKDFGVGIDYDDKSKIFERFFRVKDVQQKFSGLGIGLYVSQEIIKMHGGTIWVESELGSGSVFSFTLPILKMKKSEK